jgi:hypothetical protein
MHLFFQHKKVVIATQHRKEDVVAPLLRNRLSMVPLPAQNLNTDALGTFSGEIPRLLDPIMAMRRKCQLALDWVDADFAFASEGSFGPHPHIPFSACNDEMVMLYEAATGRHWIAREMTAQTNFNAAEINTWKTLEDFARNAGFPEHGLVCRKSSSSIDDVHKGIADWSRLREVFEGLLLKYPSVFVETDMRAMCNPTRMQIIAAATGKLIDLLHQECPQCQFPGFTVTQVIAGLPCGACGMPTRSTKALRMACQSCGATADKNNPHDRTEEDPMYCDFCNP